jgi:hypothetical protein
MFEKYANFPRISNTRMQNHKKIVAMQNIYFSIPFYGNN